MQWLVISDTLDSVKWLKRVFTQNCYEVVAGAQNA
jgi:hypothetical protein